MFKIAVNPTYTASVKVDIPSDDGKTIQRMFKAKFKRLPQSELDALTDRLKEKEMDDDAVVRAVMVGWEGVADQDGNALEFNEENLAALLEVFPTRPSIVRTFFATINGSKTKN